MSAQPDSANTIASALRDAGDRLTLSDSPRLDAEILLAHVLGQARSYLYAHANDLLTADQTAAFETLLQQRQHRVPVAYLTGCREFWSLPLAVTSATLVPRPETELLVETALTLIADNSDMLIADIGTGSGAIAIALASERRHIGIVATDNSDAALAVARHNADKLCPHRIDFRLGDWLEPLGAGRYDMIVSNPPYVEANSPAFETSELGHEPRAALAAGADGLAALQQLIHAAGNYLNQDGWLLLEHGSDQVRALTYLLESCGYRNVTTHSDEAGLPRLTLAKWPH